MVPEAIPRTNDTMNSKKLYVAIEMSKQEWKLGFTIGRGQAPRLRSVRGGDLGGLKREIQLAGERFGLQAASAVLSCYEAGRDGFFLHRYLQSQGVSNLGVDSASIEVNRRFRRAKTDHLDVGKLLTMLMRYDGGERKVWSVVHVPNVGEEDRRQLHRELLALKRDRTHQINRIKGLLASQGVMLEVKKDFLTSLEGVRLWDGSPIPSGLHSLLAREYQRLEWVRQQVHQLEVQRKEALRNSKDPAMEQVRQLMRLKGIGVNTAWLDVMEFFAWRGFHNRREIGALSGLTPTLHASGESSREQGISKAGNRPIRALAIEIAWSWLRYQPDSQLSQGYQKRFAKGSSRIRRIGIVALARKLLIALWRYLETGIPPEGACMTEA